MLLIGVTHLYVVAKDIVETNFERRNPRSLTFSFLNVLQIAFPTGRDAPQFVQFVANPRGNDASFVDERRRVGEEVVKDAVVQLFARIHLQTYLLHLLVGSMDTRFPQQADALKRHAQLLHLARRYAPHSNF